MEANAKNVAPIFFGAVRRYGRNKSYKCRVSVVKSGNYRFYLLDTVFFE